MAASPLAPTKAFWASCALVIASTLALPLVSGYGTNLFQTVVGGAWGIVASVSSDAFADLHKLVVWLVAAVLNVVLFSIPAACVLFSTRTRWPVAGTFLLAFWLIFYAASLFILFPATDGP
jgi:hypothetical protein